jgi:hypothetical protein
MIITNNHDKTKNNEMTKTLFKTKSRRHAAVTFETMSLGCRLSSSVSLSVLLLPGVSLCASVADN